MNVADRIEQAPACAVITLADDAERHIYRGAGTKLARFVAGSLVEIFDPLEHAPGDQPIESAATAALDAALRWASSADGEVWIVMCSCYQLCEPRPFAVTDASAVAHLARRIADDISDI